MSNQVDVNVVVNNLLDQISAQAREIAMLKVHIATLEKTEEVTEDGSDSV